MGNTKSEETQIGGLSERRPEDTITQLCGATIQHGTLNQRIYLMSMNDADPARLLPALDRMATVSGYTRIFAKVAAESAGAFFSAGYVLEAKVPGYFNGVRDAAFVCKYFDAKRKNEPLLKDIMETVDAVRAPVSLKENVESFQVRICTQVDVEAMAALYHLVFRSYPFPIDDPDYLADTMKSHVVYFCVEEDDRIISLSSAETDLKYAVAEMTDFATHPAYRGRGTAKLLLAEMESEMRRRNLAVLYTIARALSRPVNRLFGAAGYTFGGLLIHNTHIGGQLESMTVWHKSISRA